MDPSFPRFLAQFQAAPCMEEDLQWNFPRPPVQVDPRYPREILYRQGEPPLVLTDSVKSGSVVEIKNFAVSPDNREDIVPLLLREAFQHSEDPRQMSARASTYVIECLKELVPYYQRLGFQLYSPDPVRNGVYVMTIDREGLIKLVTERFLARPGGKIAQTATYDTGYDLNEKIRNEWLQRVSSEQRCSLPEILDELSRAKD